MSNLVVGGEEQRLGNGYNYAELRLGHKHGLIYGHDSYGNKRRSNLAAGILLGHQLQQYR